MHSIKSLYVERHKQIEKNKNKTIYPYAMQINPLPDVEFLNIENIPRHKKAHFIETIMSTCKENMNITMQVHNTHKNYKYIHIKIFIGWGVPEMNFIICLFDFI